MVHELFLVAPFLLNSEVVSVYEADIVSEVVLVYDVVLVCDVRLSCY